MTLKMKWIFMFVLFIGIKHSLFAQLSGDIFNDNRKMVKKYHYIISGSHDGIITIDFSVNAEGNVTSTKIVSGETTIKSTPAKLKAQNHVRTFQFESGTWFPKYHQGRARITMMKEK